MESVFPRLVKTQRKLKTRRASCAATPGDAADSVPPGTPRRRRHQFFLNQYDEFAFTKCPKCDQKTKLRKFPLVIHIEPATVLVLNKSCRYCPPCDLLIARQRELESLMAGSFETKQPELVGNAYFVVGTMDRADFRKGVQERVASSEMFDLTYVFEDVLHFEVTGGWQLPPGE